MAKLKLLFDTIYEYDIPWCVFKKMEIKIYILYCSLVNIILIGIYII